MDFNSIERNLFSIDELFLLYVETVLFILRLKPSLFLTLLKMERKFFKIIRNFYFTIRNNYKKI